MGNDPLKYEAGNKIKLLWYFKLQLIQILA